MTLQRVDEHGTEFSLWLRNRASDNETILRQDDPIDSDLGYRASDIDYMWQDWKTGRWMLLEEKRYLSHPTDSQCNMFLMLDKICSNSPKYCGFHLLRFENTSPEDGIIWLDEQIITKQQLLDFLQFKTIYKTYFNWK